MPFNVNFGKVKTVFLYSCRVKIVLLVVDLRLYTSLMKQNLLSIIIFVLSGFIGKQVSAQNIAVRLKDGSLHTKELVTVQKITFSNNYLLLNYSGGLFDSYNIPQINKVYFNAISTGSKTISLNNKPESISVYPNPAKEILTIGNVPENRLKLLIYGIDGVLVFQTEIFMGENHVNVVSLKNGLYVLKINNQAFKFIKQ
jgi:hypothetical protein